MNRIESIFKACLLVACSIALLSVGQAQTLNVYNVNTTNFPRVKADYVAFDATGNPIGGLKASNFRVTETPQGSSTRDVSATITHSCDSVVGDPAASIVLVVDNSNSMMNEVNGKTRFKYVQEALKGFIGRVKFNGETSVSIISFSGNSILVCDWQTIAKPLTDSIDKMKIGTATKYEMPFEGIPNLYELFASRKPTIPKYVFFLTDGVPNPLMDNPGDFVVRNTDKCNAAGIRVFAITILQPVAHYTIEQIAKGTGGKSIVTTEDKLLDLYSLLALETQVRSLCSIEWTSPYVCAEEHRNRTATVTLLMGSQPSVTLPFTTPPKSIASVTISDPVLFVGDPNPNTASSAVVTITAKGAPLQVTGFSINPSTYFTVTDWNVNSPSPVFSPFTLPVDSSRRIRVQFTQGPTRTFRQASLTLQGTPCPPVVVLVAGTGLVSLQSPIGGELFSTCDTVTIKWAGVLPAQPVTIKYSNDDGATWNSITTTATGLVYKWLPPQPGVRYRIQVSISPAKQYQWAKAYGGTGNETASSIAVCRDGSKIFATGYFDGPAKFGSFTVPNAAGDTDGYFLEIDSDGNVVRLVTLEGTASNDDRIIGVVTDNDCNYYVAGYFSSPTATFGNQSLTLQSLSTKAMFIYKFDQTGTNILWNNRGEGDGSRTSIVDCNTIGIRYVGGLPQVIVGGAYTRYIRAGVNASGIMEQATGLATPRPYYIMYDAAGYPSLSAGSTAPQNAGFVYSNVTVNDTNNFTYETGKFSGGKSFGTPPITIGSAGGTDAYVSKLGAPPSSSDASDASFSVKSPALAFAIPKAVMNPIAQGQRINTAFTAILKNTGDFPVVITAQTISGLHPTDFVLLTNAIGTRLAAGESLSLEFEFAPTATGIRSGQLVIDGSCGTTASIDLEGNGLPPCVWVVVPDTSLGKFALGQPASRTITCVLRNNGPKPITGYLTATGSTELVVSRLGVFTLDPTINPCLSVTIDVNPVSGGTKSVKLSYGLAAECGVPETTISAEVVEPRVAIDTVDLGPKRMLTQTDTALHVVNLNTDAVQITGMRVVDLTDPNFPVVTPPTTFPIDLPPLGEIRIPVTFIPRDRSAHSLSVFVTVAGQAAELEGVVKGSGFLAEIAATGYTFSQWTVNSPTPAPGLGYVTIDNVDATSTLIIDSIDFSALPPDFSVVPPLPPFPLPIAPDDAPVKIAIQFSPKTVGLITRPVRIWHQAKPGPGPIPPDTSTVVDIIGEGISSSTLPPLVFGNVLTCATKTLSITIANPNANLPLNCQAVVASGDVGAFTISDPGPFIIARGDSKVITVVFTPLAAVNYAASFNFPNDQNLDLTINVSGTGVTANADFRFGNIPPAIIGNAVSTPINVTVGSLDTVHLSEVVLTIHHSPVFLRFNSLGQPQQAGWNFVTDTPLIPGEVTIHATPIGTATISNGPFVTPVFDAFLTADSSLAVSMDATATMPCIIASGDASSITMKLVCASASRVVRLGSTQFSMGVPAPNPASDHTLIAYSTGIEGTTTFDVIDRVGNLVKTVTTTSSPSADYELDLYTDDLASGIYYLRMHSGPFVATRTLNVIR